MVSRRSRDRVYTCRGHLHEQPEHGPLRRRGCGRRAPALDAHAAALRNNARVVAGRLTDRVHALDESRAQRREDVVHIINRDGTGERLILAKRYFGHYPFSLAWSPDGRTLAFETSPNRFCTAISLITVNTAPFGLSPPVSGNVSRLPLRPGSRILAPPNARRAWFGCLVPPAHLGAPAPRSAGRPAPLRVSTRRMEGEWWPFSLHRSEACPLLA